MTGRSGLLWIVWPSMASPNGRPAASSVPSWTSTRPRSGTGSRPVERAAGARPGLSRPVDSDEVRASSGGWPRWKRTNEILKAVIAFSLRRARPPTQVIVAYINSYWDRFGVEPICTSASGHGMKIAPSTFYAHSARPVSAAALTEAYLVDALRYLVQLGYTRVTSHFRRSLLELPVGRVQLTNRAGSSATGAPRCRCSDAVRPQGSRPERGAWPFTPARAVTP